LEELLALQVEAVHLLVEDEEAGTVARLRNEAALAECEARPDRVLELYLDLEVGEQFGMDDFVALLQRLQPKQLVRVGPNSGKRHEAHERVHSVGLPRDFHQKARNLLSAQKGVKELSPVLVRGLRELVDQEQVNLDFWLDLKESRLEGMNRAAA